MCFPPSKCCRYNCTTNFLHHSQNFTFFTVLFYAFPLFQFKIDNYNCTIPILQLQTTFYMQTQVTSVGSSLSTNLPVGTLGLKFILWLQTLFIQFMLMLSHILSHDVSM